MKIANTYTLLVPIFTNNVLYGTKRRFGNRIGTPYFGKVYDCNFSQLKRNILFLKKKGFSVNQMKY